MDRSQMQPDIDQLGKSVSSDTRTKERELVFGLVDQKLIWFNLKEQDIQYLDLEEFCKPDFDTSDKYGTVTWHTHECPTIVTTGLMMSLDIKRSQGISIDEVPPGSFLHLKRCFTQIPHDPVFEKGDTNIQPTSKSYMQLTVGQHAFVFDL